MPPFATLPDHLRAVLDPLMADAERRGYERGVLDGKASGQAELLAGLRAFNAVLHPQPVTAVSPPAGPMNLSQPMPKPAVPQDDGQATDGDEFDLDAILDDLFGGEWDAADVQAVIGLAVVAVREAAVARGLDPEPFVKRIMALAGNQKAAERVMMGHPVWLAWMPVKIDNPRGKYQYRAEWDGADGTERKPLYGARAEAALRRNYGGKAGEHPDAETVSRENAEYAAARDAAYEKADEIAGRLEAGEPLEKADWTAFQDQLKYLTGGQLKVLRTKMMEGLLARVKAGKRKADRIANLQAAIASVAEFGTTPVARQTKFGDIERGSVAAAVKERGGIDPKSLALAAHFASPEEAVAHGVPKQLLFDNLGRPRKGGQSLDTLAQSLAADGVMVVPDGVDPAQALVDALTGGAMSADFAESGEYWDKQEEEFRRQQIMDDRSKQQANAEPTSRPEPEPEPEPATESQPALEDAGTSFEFGANADEQPAEVEAEQPAETAESVPSNDGEADAEQPAVATQPEPAPEVKADAVDTQAEPATTSEPDAVADESVEPAPRVLTPAERAKLDKSVGDALAAAQRKAGGRRLSAAERDKVRADVTAKFRAALETPAETPKPQPTPAEQEQAEKAAEQQARAAKFKPVEGAVGTRTEGKSGRVQAADGLWYPPDQVEEVGRENDVQPKPNNITEGGDTDAVKLASVEKAIRDAKASGEFDDGTAQAIAESMGMSATRVKQMHEDVIAADAEDAVSELMSAGKAVGKEQYEAIAKQVGGTVSQVRAAHNAVREQTAFNALQDLKESGDISPAALKKVAKDTGLTMEKVQELAGKLDNASLLAEPDAEQKTTETPAPKPSPKPKKAPAKKKVETKQAEPVAEGNPASTGAIVTKQQIESTQQSARDTVENFASEFKTGMPFDRLYERMKADNPSLTQGQFHDILRDGDERGLWALSGWPKASYELPPGADPLMRGDKMMFYVNPRSSGFGGGHDRDGQPTALPERAANHAAAVDRSMSQSGGGQFDAVFARMRQDHPDLTVGEFHEAIRKAVADGTAELVKWPKSLYDLPNDRLAMTSRDGGTAYGVKFKSPPAAKPSNDGTPKSAPKKGQKKAGAK